MSSPENDSEEWVRRYRHEFGRLTILRVLWLFGILPGILGLFWLGTTSYNPDSSSWLERMWVLPLTFAGIVVVCAILLGLELDSRAEWKVQRHLRSALTSSLIGALDHLDDAPRRAVIDELLLRASKPGRSMARAYFYGRPWREYVDSDGVFTERVRLTTRVRALDQGRTLRVHIPKEGFQSISCPADVSHLRRLVAILVMLAISLLLRDLKRLYEPALGHDARSAITFISSMCGSFGFWAHLVIKHPQAPSLTNVPTDQMVMLYVRGNRTIRSEAANQLKLRCYRHEDARAASLRLGVIVPDMNQPLGYREDARA